MVITNASPIVCYLLNREEIRGHDGILPSFRMAKAKALLFYLLAEHFYYNRSSHRREYLASLFWPDHNREAGLENLRQIWYQLRKELRKAGLEPFFQSDRRQIGFHPEKEVWSDLTLLLSGVPDQLVLLPPERIEPLPGIVFYEEEALAEWLEQFRANVQRDAVRAFSQAIDLAKGNRDWMLVEQLGIRYLAQFEEPERRAYENMALASFSQERPREAREWLFKAELTEEEISQWLAEKKKTKPNSGGGSKTIRLAVLPFQNLDSSLPGDISRGLLEDLISELSVFGELEVAPSLSVLPFSDREVTSRAVVSQLAVEYFLYGSIRRKDPDFSITIQLVQAQEDRVVWSQAFDGSSRDLFTIQQQVIRKTLEGLKQKLALHFQPEPAAIPSPEAYHLYLEGWSVYFRGNPEATREAARCFEKAVQLAPDFHRAYLGLAAMYGSMASWWGDLRVRDVEKDFYQAKEKAAEDNQLRFEISGIVGWFNMWQWDLAAAERDFQHAILQPTETSFCYSGYTHCLMMQGRFKEAYDVVQEGMRKNPTHVLNRSMLSEIFLLTGRYEECERICRTILLQMPDKHSTMTDLIWILILAGRPEKAVSVGEAFLERTGQRLYFVVGRLALANLAAGDTPNAQRLYREMEAENARGRKGYPYFMALYQQAAGQPEQALDILEKYLPDRLTDYLWLKVQPEFKPLHGHPRFDALLRSVFGKN